MGARAEALREWGSLAEGRLVPGGMDAWPARCSVGALWVLTCRPFSWDAVCPDRLPCTQGPGCGVTQGSRL